MTLLNIKYSEFEDQPRNWSLAKVNFSSNSTLVLGKNSTGKSRLLAVINSLAQAISGKTPPADGNFETEFQLNSKLFSYHLKVLSKRVVLEKLSIDGVIVLNRRENESTQLYFKGIDQSVDSDFPPDLLAVATRQDNVQHPWFVDLANWAKQVTFYSFISSFSKEKVIASQDIIAIIKNPDKASKDSSDVIGTYTRSFQKFGKKFDETVIRDLKELGFPINDVGIDNLKELIPEFPVDVTSLYLREEGVSYDIAQAFLSQGLFRAMALVIMLNAQFFEADGRLILIDDIGEGLDYERSAALLSILLKKSALHKCQLIMATNDRFAMNAVPLNHWCILEREASSVTAFTYDSHKDAFENFRYTGLSNFDFFRSGAYSEQANQE